MVYPKNRKKRTNLRHSIGQKFGWLTVIDTEYKKNRTYFICKCDCGNESSVNPSDLKRGSIKSCGCKRKEFFDKKYDENYDNRFKTPVETFLFAEYKLHGREFNLSFEEFVNLIEGNCYYCGSPPNNLRWTKTKRRSKLTNGIDRVDSNKGYFLDNCVSCCKDCNYMKRNLELNYFINHISKIYNHYENREP